MAYFFNRVAEFQLSTWPQAYRLCCDITSHHGLWPVKKLKYAYGVPNESFTVGFFMALPYLKKKILLTVLLPAHAMASSTLLRLQIPFHVMDTHNRSSKAMEGDTATRAIVPREWDDQNATSPEHSNQRKKRFISKPVIFSTKLWPLKSSY